MQIIREMHKLQSGKRKLGQDGFTLVEMLIVISIIGMLASIVLTAMTSARKKSRIAKRVADLKQVQTALELYYSDNGSYPSTGGSWRSQCAAWGSYTNANVVPGLTPGYMGSLPADPMMSTSTNNSCYLYRSDGVNYKFMDYYVNEMTNAEIDQYPVVKDQWYSAGGSCGSGADNHALSVYSLPWICAG